MNVNKNKITAIVYASLILLALTGYFVWTIFLSPAEQKSEQAFIPPAGEKPAYKPVYKIAPPENPEKILPPSITPFFENINKAAKTVETKLKNEIATTTKPIPNIPSVSSNTRILKSTPTEITLSLTNDEFRSLYPDSFIASLIDSQNLLIKSYDPAYEPLLKIETDSQVRYVEEKLVAALLSADMITKEKAEQFTTTIRLTLPQLQLMELKNRKLPISVKSLLKNFSINQSFLPLPQPLSKGTFFAGLLEKLYNAFAPEAQAAACGFCFTSPVCWQPGAWTPAPTPNLWFGFCYCTGCYTALGCLSFCTGLQAIYDPMTGICGCG